MQNPIQKFRQSAIVFEKLGILSEKLKTLTNSNYHRVDYFLLKFCTFPTYQCLQKGVRDFYYCLDLELLAKIKKDLASTRAQKPGFLHSH